MSEGQYYPAILHKSQALSGFCGQIRFRNTAYSTSMSTLKKVPEVLWQGLLVFLNLVCSTHLAMEPILHTIY